MFTMRIAYEICNGRAFLSEEDAKEKLHFYDVIMGSDSGSYNRLLWDDVSSTSCQNLVNLILNLPIMHSNESFHTDCTHGHLGHVLMGGGEGSFVSECFLKTRHA